MSTTAPEVSGKARTLPRLALGSCPDSWGVWFADDPRQTPWQRFLDELAGVGYQWLELGAYGYLPTDPKRLGDVLDRRGLTVSGGTVVADQRSLYHPDQWPDALEGTRKVAELTSAVGAQHVIFVPVPGYRDDKTGAYREPGRPDAEVWARLVRSTNELGKIVAEGYGLRLQFHHHADTYVETQAQTERFLDDTDPRYVSLCLDTGHFAYRRGDSVALIRRYGERIGYVHIKQMDPAVLDVAERDDLAFGQAVALGASCEPPKGLPDIASVSAALQELDADLFVIVEQDMYPVAFDVPRPIAQRTFDYLRGVGIGGERR
jgi:inosose dehydratase